MEASEKQSRHFLSQLRGLSASHGCEGDLGLQLSCNNNKNRGFPAGQDAVPPLQGAWV